jgi:site-specific DNA-methyltransferase (adenine-specific)
MIPTLAHLLLNLSFIIQAGGLSMMPYYTRNGITIYHGDCRHALRWLIDSGVTVDLIASDVAYRCIGGGSGSDNGPVGVLAKNDGKIFTHNNIKTADYAGLFFDILRDPAHCYVFINVLNLHAALTDFLRIDDKRGFQLHNLLGWKKNTVTPNQWYMKDMEPILFFRKGAAFPINNPSAKTTLSYPNPPAPKRHETEKPYLLMQELVTNSSQPGELVCDPFMGSGSTLEACWRTRRRCIGIDIDERYCEIAARRVDALIDIPVQMSLLPVT